MTINPGFGGQRFLEMTVPKIRQVREMIEQVNPNCELELDGSIDPTTAPIGVAAGADVLVAGSAIFDHANGVAAGVKQLQTHYRSSRNELAKKDTSLLAAVSSIRQSPIGFNLSGVAAVGAYAPPLAEGSRIKMVPSSDREKELSRGGPKHVDCCGSLCAWNNLETFATPAC
jgi:Ribulose-phosphate 3 epimerase family